jgi:DNA-directed RNA polymerase specialized sigma subunit
LARLRPKLRCRRYGIHLSDWEKKRILELHHKGMSMSSIARIMGRTNKAIMRVLAGRERLSRRDWLARMKMAAKERDRRIRHVYFVEGKNVHQIVNELHCSQSTVRRAIAASTVESSSTHKGEAIPTPGTHSSG